MTRPPGSGVRPTRKSLDHALNIVIPDIGTALDSLPHEVIRRAQHVPEEVAAGGAERIVSIDDRVWFKTKTDTWRGAVTRVTSAVSDKAEQAPGSWWLGSAGRRRADSKEVDFYEQLSRECRTKRRDENRQGGQSSKRTSSSHLLPDQWDLDRLLAELAFHANLRLQEAVRDAVATSIRTGQAVDFHFGGRLVTLCVRARDEIAYIMVVARDITNPQVFGLLFNSIPGIQSDDWGPEPGGVADLQPAADQILWSAVLPVAVQNELLRGEE